MSDYYDQGLIDAAAMIERVRLGYLERGGPVDILATDLASVDRNSFLDGLETAVRIVRRMVDPDHLDTLTVCVTHQCFVPCRTNSFDCVLSGHPAEVARVAVYQSRTGPPKPLPDLPRSALDHEERNDKGERVSREEAGGDGSSS